jgi:hypothetical protein
MPFIKDNPDGGEPLTASYSIRGPDYDITYLSHADYAYPVDGWNWVDVEPTPLPVEIEAAFDLLAAHYKVKKDKLKKAVHNIPKEANP